MSAPTKPSGYHDLTPYLGVHGAAEAIDFYRRALGAIELFRLPTPQGDIGHAEIQIGDSRFMLADVCGDGPFRSPQTLGGTSIGLHIYVADVDARIDQAVAAGAKLLRPVADQFYGDRMGIVEDPYGHIWMLATHKEDVAPDEIERRAAAIFQEQTT